MKKKLLPILVSTDNALMKALESKWCAIHIDEKMCSQNQKELQWKMTELGYAPAEGCSRRGTLYLRCSGELAFDPELHEIYDPMGIL